MKVKVERCINYFRLTWKTNDWENREIISYHDDDAGWNRRYASEALDLLENVYGLCRANIRFDVD